MRTPNLQMPHVHLPRWRRRAPARAAMTPPPGAEHHHHHPTFETARKVEGGFDLIAIALVVLFALALIYAFVYSGGAGHPAYFDRWPT